MYAAAYMVQGRILALLSVQKMFTVLTYTHTTSHLTSLFHWVSRARTFQGYFTYFRSKDKFLIVTVPNL